MNTVHITQNVTNIHNNDSTSKVLLTQKKVYCHILITTVILVPQTLGSISTVASQQQSPSFDILSGEHVSM